MAEDRVKEFLERKGRELVDKLGKELSAHSASGQLYDSIRFKVNRLSNGGYTFDLFLADYYKFVDEGRKPGGKMPPIQALIKWIGQKQFVIHPKYGLQVARSSDKKLQKVIDNAKLSRQLAFAIGTNIVKRGIKPTNFFTSTVPPWIEELKRDITKELGEFIVSEVNKK